MIVYKILFVLAGWLYFIFEGLTEAEVSTYTPDTYHKWRILENLGIIIAFHILFIMSGLWSFMLLFWLIVGTGLPLYEFSHRWKSYGNMFANKEGC